ncbi:unnamed protein product [Calypogeia fissa]
MLESMLCITDMLESYLIWVPVGTHILLCSHGSERTATHDDLCNVLVAIARDAGYHVSTEQTHVLPAVDDIPDRRQADIIFSRAGVRALADVVVVDPMRANVVSLAAHIFWACGLTYGPTQGGGVCHLPSWGFILPFCGRGFWDASLSPRPVPSVLGGPLRGAAAVPPGLSGYRLF